MKKYTEKELIDTVEAHLISQGALSQNWAGNVDSVEVENWQHGIGRIRQGARDILEIVKSAYVRG